MPKKKGVEEERSDVPDVALCPPDREEYERAMADVMEQMRQKQAQLVSCLTTPFVLSVRCSWHLRAWYSVDGNERVYQNG